MPPLVSNELYMPSVDLQSIITAAQALGCPVEQLTRDAYRQWCQQTGTPYRISRASWAEVKRLAVAGTFESTENEDTANERFLPSAEAVIHAREFDADIKHWKKTAKELAAEVSRLRSALELDRYATDHLAACSPASRVSSQSTRPCATAVVAWSDWHVEETVQPEWVRDQNIYNLGIAEGSISDLVDGVLTNVGLYRDRYEIRDLVLWLGGDLMTGWIHEEYLSSNSMTPIETMEWLEVKIARALDELHALGGFDRIIIPCSTGNHGRMTRKTQKSKRGATSFEWSIYRRLARSRPQFEWCITPGAVIDLDIMGHLHRFTHGDSVTYRGGIGGLTIPLYKRIARWDIHKRADVTVMGHFHSYMSLPNAVINGSLIGHNPYGEDGFPFEVPQQAFWLVEPEAGKTHSVPLRVRDRAPYIRAYKQAITPES